MKEQATQWDGALLAHQGRTCSACSAAMEPCCHVCSLSRPAKSSTLHLGHLLLCRQQECPVQPKLWEANHSRQTTSELGCLARTCC